jgi:hypothetical protein
MYGDQHQRGICVVTGSFISGWFTRCNFAVLRKINVSVVNYVRMNWNHIANFYFAWNHIGYWNQWNVVMYYQK